MDEIQYTASPAMFRNNPILFIASVLLIAAFGLGLLILLVWYVKCKSEVLTITQDELHYVRGILSKSRSEIRLSSIRSLQVDQSLFQRMFGTGDIKIYTAGDNPEIVVAGMPNPHEIRELIK